MECLLCAGITQYVISFTATTESPLAVIHSTDEELYAQGGSDIGQGSPASEEWSWSSSPGNCVSLKLGSWESLGLQGDPTSPS